MAAVKTYILAPNFHYKLDGPIQIGNIIADPFRPGNVLSKLPADKPPIIESVTEYSHELDVQKNKTISAGIWNCFVQFIGTDITLNRDIDSSQHYSIDCLNTQYLRDEPLNDDPDLLQRLKEPKVQAAIQAGLFGRQPIYMITGIKIARGLSVDVKLGKGYKFSAGSSIPLSESIFAKVNTKLGNCDRISNSFKTGSEDVVFAYQLHKIRQKGNSKKPGATIIAFESEAAFLHDDNNEESNSGEEVVLVGTASVDELLNLDDESKDVQSFEVIDGESRCTVIMQKDKA